MGNVEFTSHLEKDQLNSLSSEKLDLSRRLTSYQLDQHLRNEVVEENPGLVEIPARLFAHISFYETLIVSFHCITQIPQELPLQLPHLIHLNLNFNRISSLPESFGMLIHLEILELSHNLLSKLPNSFSLLKSLQKLDLSNNKLRALRDDMDNLKKLKKLNVNNNFLEQIPLSLCLIDSLEVLVCLNNRLTTPHQDICDKGLASIRQYFEKEHALPLPRQEDIVNIFPRVRKGDAFTHPNLNTAMTQLYNETQTQSFHMKVKVKTPLLPPTMATTFPPDELSNKIIGCIYGAAIGSALGYLTDFLSKSECAFYYDKEQLNYCDIINDIHRNNFEKGCWTHSFDQMILILDSILSWGGVVDELDVARRLASWNKNGFSELGEIKGPDFKGLFGKILNDAEYTKDPHFVAKMISHEKQYCSNAAVARTAVLSVSHFYDLDEVCANAARICKCTHADARCIASCVAVNTIIALLLQGKHDLNDNDSVEAILFEAAERSKRYLDDGSQVSEINKYVE
ncbi:protein lap1-like [Dendronephthya gigantea]|uniref:protein lap1-like n=1 Tax=Dendronephthya gigantea TaxID=151771 RepID=UPI00106B487B|nr:protein lap1-like [Dendronephthya gigantea]